MTDSDNESVATEDLVEHPVEQEAAPEEAAPEEAAPEPEPEVKPEAKPKRPRGRPKGKGGEATKSSSTLSTQLTKSELIKMVEAQHQLLAAHKARDEENEKYITETLANQRKKREVRAKKPRTQAQIAATERMIKARKEKRQKELAEVGKEIAADVDKSLSDKVEEVVTNLVLQPLRALTPERVKKVQTLTEPPKKSKFHWSGADAFFR
jgi:urease gamma subunit